MEIAELEQLITSCGNDKKKQAIVAEALYVFLYTHPALFRLEKLDSDIRSDFIFSLWVSFQKLPLRFMSSKGRLLTYLQIIVLRNFKSWQRGKIKHNATEKSVYTVLTQEYSELYCGETEAGYGELRTEQDNLDWIFNANIKLTPIKILILALKSFMVLTPSFVKKLSLCTGYDEERLWSFKFRLEEENSRKIERFNRHIRGINTSYILRNRYQWELEHLNPDSQHFVHIERSYLIQNRRWKEKLHKMPKPVLATNPQIAKLLNIPERIVVTFMVYVRKKNGINFSAQVLLTLVL